MGQTMCALTDRVSICGVTLAKLPLEQQLGLARELGCGGVGIFHPALPATLAVDDLRRSLDVHELKATICVPSPFTLLPRFGFSGVTGQRTTRGDALPASLDAILTSLAWLAPLRPQCVLVIPGAQGVMSRDEAWDKVRAGLVRICAAAEQLGLNLAIEPVHPRFASDFSIVATIDEALAMISDVGADNLGVLIEIFHVWDLDDRFEQIARAKGRIAGVQLSDSPAYPRSLVDRLPPGEGVADIAAIVRAIAVTGYDGWYDIEVLSDDGTLGVAAYPDSCWRSPPREFARRCVGGSMAALRAAGL